MQCQQLFGNEIQGFLHPLFPKLRDLLIFNGVWGVNVPEEPKCADLDLSHQLLGPNLVVLKLPLVLNRE